MRSALNDAAAAKKIKPDHLKALIRGVHYTHMGFPLQQHLIVKYENELKTPLKSRACLVHVSAGAQCCIELRTFADAVQWCDEGLKAYPADKKLLELRAAADKHKALIQSLMTTIDFGAVVVLSVEPKDLFIFCVLESSRPRRQEGQGQRKKASW